MDDRKPFGYLYRTTFFVGVSKFVYVGKRQKPRFTAAYKGSGKHVRESIEAARNGAVSVELVGYYYTKNDLFAAERDLIKSALRDHGKNCLNISIGPCGGGKKIFWTLERLKAVSVKYHSKKEWATGHPNSYASALRQGVVDLCCEHMCGNRVVNGYWTIEKCKAVAEKFSSRKEWYVKHIASYTAAHRAGWIDACCKHMKRKIAARGFWTLARCIKKALRFKTRTDWVKGHRTSYQAAWKNGWLDQCCDHMTYQQLPNGYWTLENCRVEARKFKTRTAWQKGHTSSYSIARRKGWLDICMPRPTSIDTKQAA